MSETPEFAALEHQNLGELVYWRIAEALMRGRFEPNQRITIRDLAQSLGTSVTPVRDAILRLVQDEALIQTRPREVRVPVLSSSRYQEIRMIRMRLEGLAARQCALTATPDDIGKLRQLIARNEDAIADERWLDALEINQMFHSAFADMAGMPVLSGILNRLWLQMGPLLADAYKHGGRTMINTHYAIVEAVAAGAADAAEAAMIKDIGDAGTLIFGRIDVLNAQTQEI